MGKYLLLQSVDGGSSQLASAREVTDGVPTKLITVIVGDRSQGT